MSMDAFSNMIRKHAAMINVGRAACRIGIVKNYNPGPPYPTVKVALQPDGTLTGYLPITAQWVGNGWGMFGAPNIGDCCEVQFQEDGAGGGFVVGRFWNVDAQGIPVPSGEFWCVHESGAYFKLTNDGKLSLNDAAGSTIIMNGDGTGTISFVNGLTVNAETTLNGSLDVSDNVTVNNGASGTFTSLDGFTITVQDGITTNIY